MSSRVEQHADLTSHSVDYALYSAIVDDELIVEAEQKSNGQRWSGVFTAKCNVCRPRLVSGTPVSTRRLRYRGHDREHGQREEVLRLCQHAVGRIARVDRFGLRRPADRERPRKPPIEDGGTAV